MAKGTPSNTIPLGSELLNAMGDIKGAAKAAGDEAKAAKADLREVQKELKTAERDAKKARDQIERLEKKGGTVSQEERQRVKDLEKLVDQKSSAAMAAGQKATEKSLAQAAAKDRVKAERDRIAAMNQYEKRVNSKLFGVKDSLVKVGSTLEKSNLPGMQRLARSINATAGGITQESLASITQVGGVALRAAGIAGAGVAGGLAVAGFGQRIIRRNIEATQIRGEISDTMTAALKSLSGQTNTGVTAGAITAGFETAAKRAREQIAKETLTGRFIDPSSGLGEFLGMDKSAAAREKVLADIFLEDKRLSEKFGADVAGRLDLKTLEKSKSVRDVVKRNINENISRGVLSKTLGALSFLPVAAAEKALLDKYYEAADAEALNAEARKQRADLIKGIKDQIESDKLKVLRDPQGASKRKQNALRDQSLEAERQRRDMQIARF